MTSFDLTGVKAVLFDLDGTLIDTDDLAVESLARYLTPLARLFSADPSPLARRLVMWAETPGNALVTLLDMVGLDDNIFSLGDTLRRWRGLHPRRNLPLIPNVDTALDSLADRYRLGIVTTRGRRDAESFLSQHTLGHLFEVVITREDTHRLKPHTDPVRLAAKKLGLSCRECVMVGDTTADVRSARAADMGAIAVLSGFGEHDELHRSGAHHILNSVAQIGEILLDNFS
jgi:HAD superfamily hydrolase (TIGR01509 family)